MKERAAIMPLAQNLGSIETWSKSYAVDPDWGAIPADRPKTSSRRADNHRAFVAARFGSIDKCTHWLFHSDRGLAA
jgi:hypothetical protein